MTAFSFTRDYLKKIFPFLAILAILLGLSAVFNAFFSWDGIFVILRVYLYSMSFLLIYNAHSSQKSDFLETYQKNIGAKSGYLIYSFESKILPYAIIYIFVILFGLVSFVDVSSNFNIALLKFFEGKYTNLMMYCLFLSLLLRFQNSFIQAVAIFIISLISFFWADYWFQKNVDEGIHYSVYKFVKLNVFFFFVLWDTSSGRMKLIKYVSSALAVSILVFGGSILFLKTTFDYSSDIPAKKEAGNILVRMGYSAPLNFLAYNAYSQKRNEDLIKLNRFFAAYNKTYPFSNEEWNTIIFYGSMQSAENAAYLINRWNKKISYKELVDFAFKASSGKSSILEGLNEYTVLTSRMITGNESYLMDKISESGKSFTVWGIQVLGLSKSKESILFLVKYLTNIDKSVSTVAYSALKNITGKDPARESNKNINSAEVIKEFKDIYLYRDTVDE
ncbi:MAG TPA: hypothetical protein PK158_05200 [Spirochaetota bacterium]|nr:hypothetical protein [Spirochaetota bacterium]